MVFKFKRTAQAVAVSACLTVQVGVALAIDISPDLFVEGSCEDVIVWAAQPVDVLQDDLQAMLGDGMAALMKSSSGSTILDMSNSMPVANNWFEKNCTFSDAELAAMGNLHTAYVLYLEGLAGS